MLFSLWFDFLHLDHALGAGEKPAETKDAGAGQTLDTRMFVKNLQNVRLNSSRVFTAVPCQERSVA